MVPIIMRCETQTRASGVADFGGCAEPGVDARHDGGQQLQHRGTTCGLPPQGPPTATTKGDPAAMVRVNGNGVTKLNEVTNRMMKHVARDPIHTLKCRERGC
ncbi:hypothetical protein ACFOWZ_05720 [Lentzea rhizosphaerae]|uniref:Uncharacterized protein n=1 Tax=Lentzea rhizosphaerae TaxID=2041025 RepID=A0ABV8BM15_9PSEU